MEVRCLSFRVYSVARLILAQPASASICERINSEFAFIKDRRRNKLGHGKADKLVALFHNNRIQINQQKVNYTEPAVGWVKDENRSEITKWGIAGYE